MLRKRNRKRSAQSQHTLLCVHQACSFCRAYPQSVCSHLPPLALVCVQKVRTMSVNYSATAFEAHMIHQADLASGWEEHGHCGIVQGEKAHCSPVKANVVSVQGRGGEGLTAAP